MPVTVTEQDACAAAQIVACAEAEAVPVVSSCASHVVGLTVVHANSDGIHGVAHANAHMGLIISNVGKLI